MNAHTLLNRLRNVCNGVSPGARWLAAIAVDSHSDLNQLRLRVLQPRLKALVGHRPVACERRDPRAIKWSGLDTQHPAHPVDKLPVDRSPDIWFPIVVKR